ATFEAGCPRQVRGDPHRFRQILVNLIGNAVKFTNRGLVHVALAAGPNGRLQCSVTDTGIGISGPQMGQLFKPFSQADSSTTRRYGGTGLGLVICQRLIERMQGTLNVKSKPAKGTTVSFVIPLPEEVRAVPPAPNPTEYVLSPLRPYRVSVLVAEDNLFN